MGTLHVGARNIRERRLQSGDAEGRHPGGREGPAGSGGIEAPFCEEANGR